MPFCGISRFAVPVFQPVFGRDDQGATALLGRGSFAFIVQGNAEPRLGKCNDSRLFLYPCKFDEVHCGTRQTP